MIHGSDPNRSKRPRIGVAIRYIPTRNRQISQKGTAMLVRGIDNYKNFEHEQAPSGHMLEQDLNYMEKINVQNDLILYDKIEWKNTNQTIKKVARLSVGRVLSSK